MRFVGLIIKRGGIETRFVGAGLRAWGRGHRHSLVKVVWGAKEKATCASTFQSGNTRADFR